MRYFYFGCLARFVDSPSERTTVFRSGTRSHCEDAQSSRRNCSAPAGSPEALAIANTYERGEGVGRGLGAGTILGVGVGRGVALGSGGVGVAVGVTVAVGVGVAVPVGAWIETIIGEPVLKKPTVAVLACGA